MNKIPTGNVRPATQAEAYHEPILVEGDIMTHYGVGRRLALGGQGKVYSGREKTTGREVVIKRYNGEDGETVKDWDYILRAEQGAAREIGFLRRANADHISHLPILLAAGVTRPFNDPVAVFEPIDGETVREHVLSKGYSPSIDEVRKIIQLLKDPINYAHTFQVRPVVHRDIRPENAMINGKGATLIDWGYSTDTSGKSILRTQLVPDGFVAPEITAGQAFDGRADNYGIGRIIQYMLLGHDHFEDADRNPSASDFEKLNIPRGLVGILEKATRESPADRFNTALEFYTEAERVLKGNSLPVRAETKKKEVSRKEDYIVKLLEDGSVQIGYRVPEFLDKPYGGHVFEGKTVYDILRSINTQLLTIDSDKATLAYARHIAPKFPILQEILGGKKTLEDVLKEKKREIIKIEGEKTECIHDGSWGNTYLYPKGTKRLISRGKKIVEQEATIGTSTDGYDDSVHVNEWADIRVFDASSPEAKDTYQARRQQLYEILGVDKEELQYWNQGGGAGLLAGALLGSLTFFTPLDPSLYAWSTLFAGTTVLGSIVGSNIQRYFVNRKLRKQAREMTSWIAEAQRTQNPSALEGKVGDVELTNIEKLIIKGKSHYISGAATIPAVTGALIGAFRNDPTLAWTSCSALIPTYFSINAILKKILTNRAIKQKRLAAYDEAGLDEDGMREYVKLKIKDPEGDLIRKLLKEKGLKKKWMDDEFVGNGIKIRFQDEFVFDDRTEYSSRDHMGHYYDNTKVSIRATSKEKAKEIIEALRPLSLPGASSGPKPLPGESRTGFE